MKKSGLISVLVVLTLLLGAWGYYELFILGKNDVLLAPKAKKSDACARCEALEEQTRSECSTARDQCYDSCILPIGPCVWECDDLNKQCFDSLGVLSTTCNKICEGDDYIWPAGNPNKLR